MTKMPFLIACQSDSNKCVLFINHNNLMEVMCLKGTIWHVVIIIIMISECGKLRFIHWTFRLY